jgi:4-diphosphocytidyl-2-C-methyl-D-erythritol kinase
MSLGVQLGADVPFFLLGQAAFVSGIGEQMCRVPTPRASYLVFQPAAAVPTVSVFRDPDLTRDTEPVKISDFSGRAYFLDGSNGVGFGRFGRFGRNDLEPIARRQFSAIDDSMRWVSDQGFDVRLSGSGCCFFAEQETPLQAELARAGLVAKMTTSHQSGRISDALVNIIACDGLPRHPLAGWIED